MSEPLFRLKIVYPDGSDVVFNAGNPLEDPCEGEQKCIECAIIDDICKQGVGVLKTEQQVRKAVAQAFMNLKERTRVLAK